MAACFPLPKLAGALGSCIFLLLSGCQATNPTKATVVAQPTTPVVKNLTSFSNSLRCMDDLLLSYGKRDIIITSDGLPDETGQISAGTKDMMITTLSKMSEKSKAFRFIDIERGGAVEFIQLSAGQSFALPDYYIRGAVTQVDRNVLAESTGAGIALPWASLGYGEDQLLSLVTIDVNIGDTIERQIIPGLHTTNTITVVRTGSGLDTEGIIKKASLFFEVSQDKSQGTHQSLRTLIELSLIEVLGKLTKVPYWRCLGLQTTDPTYIEQSREWFDEMSAQQQIKTVQSGLSSTGDYSGPEDGKVGNTLQQAIQRYQARNDLVATGRVDFDLYYRLLSDEHARLSVPHNKTADNSDRSKYYNVSRTPSPARDNTDPVGLKVEPAAGANAAYHVGDQLFFKVSVDNPAEVHCYYEFVEGEYYRVARVFPNRWQSNAYITPNQPISIPSRDADFELILNEPGVREQLACIATTKPYTPASLPLVFQEQDLESLQDAQRLFQVIDQYQTADPYNTSVKTLSWAVR